MWEIQYNWTPLHVAAASGHVQIVNLLLDEGADVNARDKVLYDSSLYIIYSKAKYRTEVLKLSMMMCDAGRLDCTVSSIGRWGYGDGASAT